MRAATIYQFFKYTPIALLLASQQYAMGHVVGLDWTDNSDNETGFFIERSINGSDFEVVGETSANKTSYQDATIQTDTLYSYRVRAFNEFGVSGYTNVASHEIPDLAPSISYITDYSFNSGESVTVTFSVSDDFTVAGDLLVSATSSNTNVIPQQSIQTAGTGGSYTLSIPASSTTPGTSIINLSVFDGKQTTSSNFNLTIIEEPAPSIDIDFIASADSESLHSGEPFLVSLNIEDTDRIQSVDYYIDGELSASSTEAPFDGLLVVDQTGSTDLKIVAHLNGSSKSVEIEQTLEIQDPLLNLDFLAALKSADLGSSKDRGITEYDRSINSVLMDDLNGTIFRRRDTNRFAYVSVTGDFTFTARLSEMAYPLSNSEAGLMVRSSLHKKSAQTSVLLNSLNQIKVLKRTADFERGSKQKVTPSTSDAQFFRIKRQANKFKIFVSNNGTNWEKIKTTTFDPGTTCLVGLAVSQGRNDGTESTIGVFDSIKLDGEITAAPSE